MADKAIVSIEDIRTQCVVITKAVIELRKSQQKYYRCFRDNPRKAEFLAESKMNEHKVDMELVKYDYLLECFKNQNLPQEEQDPTEYHQNVEPASNVVTDHAEEPKPSTPAAEAPELPF